MRFLVRQHGFLVINGSNAFSALAFSAPSYDILTTRKAIGNHQQWIDIAVRDISAICAAA